MFKYVYIYIFNTFTSIAFGLSSVAYLPVLKIARSQRGECQSPCSSDPTSETPVGVQLQLVQLGLERPDAVHSPRRAPQGNRQGNTIPL